MKLKINLCGLIIVFLIFGTSVGALARDDWENWSALNLKKGLNEKTDLKLSLTGRFRDDISDFYYGGVQIGPVFKVNKYFQLSPAYYYIESKSGGHFDTEHRYMLDATFNWKVKKLKLCHRSRFEYRDLPSLSRWRYRDFIKIGLPTKFFNHDFTPYVSEEIFYEERRNEFNQNRVSLGTTVKINKTVELDIYYLLRSDKSGGDWSERNVFGTSLNLNF